METLAKVSADLAKRVGEVWGALTPPNENQIEMLDMAWRNGGVLCRFYPGVWSFPGVRLVNSPDYKNAIPEWSGAFQTMWSLECRGFLQRMNVPGRSERTDDREIVVSRLRALEEEWMGREQWAYDIVSLRQGDQFVPHVKVACARCPKTTTKRLAKANLPPEVIGKLLRREGWELDPLKRSSVRCPDCQKIKAVGEKPNKEKSMPDNVTVIAQRELTPEERQRVRTLLDSQFDDSKGMYLEGYSDQRVGEEAKVPWSAVRKMREAAYGPLKTVPELEALAAEQRAIAVKVAEATASLTALQAQSNDLAKRIAGVATKMGVAAA